MPSPGRRSRWSCSRTRAPGRCCAAGGWPRPRAAAAWRRSAYAETHPSLPNYLALVSGSTQGVTSDDVSVGPFGGPTLMRQLDRAGVSWRAYMNAMPAPCFDGGGADVAGRYAKRHDPFLFFSDVVADPARCRRRVVPGSRLAADERRGLPRFSWLTPDLCQDMHDCPVAAGQRWMSGALPPLIRALGPKGVLFVVADEGTDDSGCCGGAHGGRIPLVVLGAGARPGARFAGNVTHRALLATIEDRLGLGRLPATRGAPTLAPLLRGS